MINLHGIKHNTEKCAWLYLRQDEANRQLASYKEDLLSAYAKAKNLSVIGGVMDVCPPNDYNKRLGLIQTLGAASSNIFGILLIDSLDSFGSSREKNVMIVDELYQKNVVVVSLAEGVILTQNMSKRKAFLDTLFGKVAI